MNKYMEFVMNHLICISDWTKLIEPTSRESCERLNLSIARMYLIPLFRILNL